ncbi:MAG: hypothetical protein ACFHWX_10685 [Bacteroidota bacterium]
MRIIGSILLILTLFSTRGQWFPDDIQIIEDNKQNSFLNKPDSKGLLASILNQLEVSKSLKPLNIQFDMDSGLVVIKANYDHEEVFEKGSEYQMHNQGMIDNTYNRGISILVERKVFTALGLYANGFVLPRLATWPSSFGCSLKLQKPNGDWIQFYAAFQKDPKGYLIQFDEKSSGKVGQESFEVIASDPYALQKMSYYFVGKPYQEDGTKNGAYHFCQFFEVEVR